MGIFEKLKYQIDTTESKLKKSHIKNLFSVALADGIMANVEFDYILEVADNMYVERAVVQNIYSNLNDVPFIVPLHEKQRLDQMFDLIQIALIDGDLDPREILTCKSIFIQFGYKPVIFEILLNTIVDALRLQLFKDAVIESFMRKYLN
jgi:hypothetical protein